MKTDNEDNRENNALDRRESAAGRNVTTVYNRRCSCSCTLHRRLHFRNCKGLVVLTFHSSPFYATFPCPPHGSHCIYYPHANLRFAAIVSPAFGSVFLFFQTCTRIVYFTCVRSNNTAKVQRYHFHHYQNCYYHHHHHHHFFFFFWSFFSSKRAKKSPIVYMLCYYTVGDNYNNK